MTMTRVLAGLALLAAAVSAAIIAAQERRLSTWQPAPAVVTESRERTYRTNKGGSSRTVRIRYLYRVDGREYESTRIYPGPLATTGGDSAELRTRFPVGSAVTAFVDPDDPGRAFLVPLRSFLPYLIGLLVAAPLAALAAGIATGGVRYVRSSERETPAPVADERGGFVVRPFRSYRALRNAAAAALAVFAPVGGIVFVDYFGRPGPKGATAVFALLGWLALLARLAWAVVKRTWVGGRLDDGRLAIRPSHPVAGTSLHVVFDQPVRTDVWVRAVDLTLVAERLTVRTTYGRTRTKKLEIARQRLRLSVDARAWPSAPIHVEGTVEVPAEATEEGGFLSWRIEARTRMRGPDYFTRFPIGGPETDS